MAQASLLTFFGGPGGGQPMTMMSRNSGGTGPAGHAPLGPELAALWQRVEGTGDLLTIVMRQLAEIDSDGEGLARAGSASRVWREAARDEDAWKRLCSKAPLLTKLKAQPWCRLGWRELFVQRKDMEYVHKVESKNGVAAGPLQPHDRSSR